MIDLHRALARFLVAATSAIVVCAQERVPVVGRVLAADGKPWPDAEIVLHAAVHPHFPALGVVDHVVGRSDGQGRFRVDVLAGRNYAAFAREVRGDGNCRHSAIATSVTAAAPLELRDAVGWRPPARLVVQGVEAWQDAGPLRIHFAPALQLPPLELAASGALALPPLPSPYAGITLRTAAGIALRAEQIPTLTEAELDLVRRPLLVRALDGPGGKPVAGASVLLVVQGEVAEIGRTDADGYADVTPGPNWHQDTLRLSMQQLCVSAPGSGLGLLRIEDARARSDEERQALRARGAAQGLATLVPGHELTGVVRCGPDRRLADLPLLVTSAAGYSPRPGSHMATEITRIVRCGGDGTFRLRDLAPGATPRLLTMLPPEAGSALHAYATNVLLLCKVGGTMPAGQATRSDFDLGAVRPLRFEVVTPDGAPALDAEIVLELGSSEMVPLRLRGDRRGLCRVPLPVGGALRVAIHTPTACWVGAVEALAGDGEQPLPIRLWPRRRGLVTAAGVDGAPEPVRVEATHFEIQPRWQPPVPAGPGFLGAGFEGDGPQAVGKARLAGSLSGSVHWLLPPAVAAAPAGVELLLPPIPGRWGFAARHGHRNAFSECAFDEGTGRVEVSIPAPAK